MCTKNILFLIVTLFTLTTQAQVAASTFENADADFSKPSVTNSTFMGTIGGYPSPIDAPWPADWWSVMNIRHRNGGADGPLWGTQVAIGLTYQRHRMFFRGQAGGSWDNWTEVATQGAPGLRLGTAEGGEFTQLHVATNSIAEANITVENQNPTPSTASIGIFQNDGNGARYRGYALHINSQGNFSIARRMNLVDNYHTFTIENTTGNVGIGTANPAGYKLAVAGAAVAEKMVIKKQLNWPDFVFEESYKLPTLHETEAFIRRHKHLPGVPTATEVGVNGLDVGANQAVLLQKIEELTLHIIEQNRRLAALEQKLKKLDK